MKNGYGSLVQKNNGLVDFYVLSSIIVQILVQLKNIIDNVLFVWLNNIADRKYEEIINMGFSYK